MSDNTTINSSTTYTVRDTDDGTAKVQHFRQDSSGRTAGAPTSVSVGVSSTSVLGASATRRRVVLINVSSARISLAFGTSATLDSGITLYPKGILDEVDPIIATSAINGIASVAASKLTIQVFTS